jgi:4a-hydroxytetrahydrobiopterin dehydratase
MTESSTAALKAKSCRPCEGEIRPLSRDEAQRLLRPLPGWELSEDGSTIRRHWTVKNFKAGIDFLHRVAGLAEKEGHHPDVHLTGYRHVTVALTTHALKGLSENDFIMAAKIDDLDIELQRRSLT